MKCVPRGYIFIVEANKMIVGLLVIGVISVFITFVTWCCLVVGSRAEKARIDR